MIRVWFEVGGERLGVCRMPHAPRVGEMVALNCGARGVARLRVTEVTYAAQDEQEAGAPPCTDCTASGVFTQALTRPAPPAASGTGPPPAGS